MKQEGKGGRAGTRVGQETRRSALGTSVHDYKSTTVTDFWGSM